MRTALSFLEAGLFLMLAVSSAASLTRTSVLAGDLDFQFSDYSLGSSPVALAIVGVLLVYMLTRWARGSLFPLWVLGGLGLVAQLPAVLAHNRLDWFGFLRDAPVFDTGLSSFAAGLLFVLSIVLLVAIHRVVTTATKLDELRDQGVDEDERNAMARNEVAIGVGATGAGVVLTLVAGGVAALLGGADALFSDVPWTVFTVGAAGAAIVAGYLWAVLREGQEGAEPAADDETPAAGAEPVAQEVQPSAPPALEG